jgi:CDP-glucose 4,6-dehydratase
MLETGSFGEGWNFGADDRDTKPVDWVVAELATLWGEDAGWQLDGDPQPHEARFLKLDSSKARAELGWESLLPLAEALEWTAEWYRKVRDGEDVREVTEDQIDQYRSRIASSRPDR